MRNRLFLSMLTITFALAFVSCGGSDNNSSNNGGTTAELTQEEADAVAAVISTATASAGIPGIPAVSRRSLPRTLTRAQTGTVTIDLVNVSCPVSGSASVSGEYTGSGSGETFQIDYELANVFDECTATGGNDVDYTVDGEMNSVGEMTGSATSGEATQTTSGTLDISGGDLDITGCVINITHVLSWTTGTINSFEYSWSGTICGVSMNGSANFSN